MEKNNSIVSQQKSGISTRIYDNDSLKASLVICLDRLSLEPKDLSNMIEDIRSCYPDIKTKHITGAIKNGAMGVYGRTYRFSFQEVSIWIRAYKKENINGKGTGGVSMEDMYNENK